jgi:hydrogenase maturation protein HypF
VPACRIHITGIVQGVGFRPFVSLLAERLGVEGWVRNTSSGVDIEIEGPRKDLDTFIEELRGGGPPAAHIESFHLEEIPSPGFEGFQILKSAPEEGAYQPISPDMSICKDCRCEMLDPEDRRYRYPFINCTNCGPRFTIIQDIPYDRPNTTMALFQMCTECAGEYEEPSDRRFHAQPVACPACGPRVWLECNGERVAEEDEAITVARNLLRQGGIVAAKGLGGFHLACDALSEQAVAELRLRKRRDGKPFALMAFDVETVERYVNVADADRQLLRSTERPIVLMVARDDAAVAPGVAPGLNTLGIMLPYTPLHYLLLSPEPDYPELLVMTSGNMSEEPIAYQDEEALKRLADIADGFVLHHPAIHTR